MITGILVVITVTAFLMMVGHKMAVSASEGPAVEFGFDPIPSMDADEIKGVQSIGFMGARKLRNKRIIGRRIENQVKLGWKRFYPQWLHQVKKSCGPNLAFAQTSGNIGQIPIWINPGLIDQVKKDLILYPRIRKVVATTLDRYWNTKTARHTASWKAEDAAQSATQMTIYEQHVSIKYAYAQSETTNIAPLAAQENYDLLNETIMDLGMAIYELTEKTILTGDGASDSFKGLTNIVDTNVVDALGASVTKKFINQAKKKAYKNKGRPMFGVTDYTTLESLSEEVLPHMRVKEYDLGNDIFADGIKFNKMLIVGHDEMPDTDGNRQLLLIDERDLELHIMQPLVMDDLGISETKDNRQYRGKMFSTLVDKSANDSSAKDGTGGLHHAIIDNLA